jgi:DNA-binding MarR family transcriptional regulator
MRFLTEHERTYRNASLLCAVRAVKCASNAASEPVDALSGDQLRLLIEAAYRPWLGVTKLYDRAGLDRATGRKAVEALHAQGLVTPTKISSGQRGGRITLALLTDSGQAVLRERDLPVPENVVRGSTLHRAVALALGEAGKHARHDVRYEFEVNGVYVDVAWISALGELLCHQVGLSKPAWEAKNIRKLMQAQGVTQITLIGKNQSFNQKVTRQLSSELTADEICKVAVRCAGDALKAVQEL